MLMTVPVMQLSQGTIVFRMRLLRPVRFLVPRSGCPNGRKRKHPPSCPRQAPPGSGHHHPMNRSRSGLVLSDISALGHPGGLCSDESTPATLPGTNY